MYNIRDFVRKFAFLTLLGLFVLQPTAAFAIIYQPGETLDPACLPADPTCTVAVATTTDGLPEGVHNFYFTVARWAAQLAGTTTDALAQGAVNRYYSDAFVQSFINASTTIPKTYTANTFTGSNIFNGGLTVGNFQGPLQANNGVVSATTSVGVLYGGTGVTSFGQGWVFSSGGVNPLSASTSPTVNYITATSTTATSTFGGGVSINGGLKLGSLPSCHNIGTDNLGNIECEVGQFAIDARKPADQATTSSAVLANDKDLSFPIGSNETWVFRFDLLYSTGAAPDIQVAITAPTGAICDYAAGQFASALGVGATACGTSLPVTDATVVDQPMILAGSVSNSGVAGTVHFQFAQNTANPATTTILRGSSMSAFRISGGADVGEVYYAKDLSLTPGTIVALDATLPSGVRRARAYDKQALGIVSTKPGVVIGDTNGAQDGIPVIVALVGRVPVEVTAENGAIEPGDYLTPSSQPGVAMKSTGLGQVIGLAMAAYDGAEVGSIVASVKNFDTGMQGGLTGGGQISSSTLTDIQSETPYDAVTVLSKKISDGMQFITDVVSARVTAVRGYFDEVFAKKVYTDVICLKKNDGTEVCINGDQLQAAIGAGNSSAVSSVPASNAPATTDRTVGDTPPVNADTTAAAPMTTDVSAGSNAGSDAPSSTADMSAVPAGVPAHDSAPAVAPDTGGQ